MGAERIGHGYRVLEDEDIFTIAKKSNVHFEVMSTDIHKALYRYCVAVVWLKDVYKMIAQFLKMTRQAVEQKYIVNFIVS